MKNYETSKLIKSQDLNHHDTLFAGRLAEWIAEASFMGASDLYGKYGETDHLVAVEMHSMKYLGPSFNGDIIRFVSTGIQAGKTSLTVYTKALRNDTDVKIAECFVTFVCIDFDKQKIPHNIVIGEPETEEEKEIVEKFKKIRGK
ncbi:acyl-CoA hydrolase [Dethiosulfatibacter aminovorans DSM 17477]|uniref:Acyl-CoA hydrolase n=1 Tax=Dethiosulfatibacter aminovorans DSM 17477 TaxID=1121476 RepID=A0A1M6GMZ0_9FIRM|nr:hotdog domain-containing protein [Dethiosulfatibacter aminovorans]SHJ11291.1 acyl-CoA hydrolase [Dethiosulfatibacter aminovorans DSM 17477]